MVEMTDEQYLAHYGTPRHSGRYEWGSHNNVPGGAMPRRNREFLDYVADLRRKGLTQTQIAQGMGMKTTEFRARVSIANNEKKQADIAMAEKLKATGMSVSAIGRQMGVNESTIRSLLKPGAAEKAAVLNATADMLENQFKTKKYIDVGTGVNLQLGISQNKLDNAVAVLKEKGYVVHPVQVDQVNQRTKTTVKVLAPPGTTYTDIVTDKGSIDQITEYTKDGGNSYFGMQPPISISSKRLAIKYAEDGGAASDGVIYVRPGKEDLSLGANRYAQVRIAIDDSHYIKGMALYKDDLPRGVDLEFHTNKSNTGNKLDALKKLEPDPDSPFGSVVKQLGKLDENGFEIPNTVRSAMNLVNSEGQWDKWSKSLSSQMLSKQPPSLIKSQLAMTYEKRQNQLDEIMAMTNPSVRKKLLEVYADETDSAAVHLKAAALPAQKTQVILPVNSVKEDQIYAPNFKHGDSVALIRFPHGGLFEIPILTVNNRNVEGKKLLGDSQDAVGINSKVAERLSGADFDGDTVLVIPNNAGKVKSKPALEGLKNFDPKIYKLPADAPEMKEETKQIEMGKISNLITDMTIKGANNEELARAVRHSMVVIDAAKHHLNYKESAKQNNIQQLKVKYQSRPNSTGYGAATVISNSGSSSKDKIPAQRLRRASEGGPVNPKTGELVYVPTGETYVDKKGVTVPVLSEVKRLSVRDANEFNSGTPQETMYAEHSNNLKALANLARKEAVNTKPIAKSSSARTAYANEVATLDASLNIALKNRPLERQAQLIANAAMSAKRAANPNMDRDESKKLAYKALVVARERTGAGKERIEISDKEWEAIQAGAISPSKLDTILDNANIETVKKHATPRKATVMTAAKLNRAKAMIANGYAQADIAAALGVPASTLNSALGR